MNENKLILDPGNDPLNPGVYLKAYTDGGCSNNGGFKEGVPSIGKFGFVILDEQENIVSEFGVSSTDNPTNNKMEIAGIIAVLTSLEQLKFDKCTIYTDSQYCLLGFSNYEKWFKKKKLPNREFWEVAIEKFKKLEDKIEFVWIKGHQNDNNWNDYIDLKLQKTL